MEAVCASETSLNYQTAGHQITEDSTYNKDTVMKREAPATL
jgi:hypothetical protein